MIYTQVGSIWHAVIWATIQSALFRWNFSTGPRKSNRCKCFCFSLLYELLITKEYCTIYPFKNQTWSETWVSIHFLHCQTTSSTSRQAWGFCEFINFFLLAMKPETLEYASTWYIFFENNHMRTQKSECQLSDKFDRRSIRWDGRIINSTVSFFLCLLL